MPTAASFRLGSRWFALLCLCGAVALTIPGVAAYAQEDEAPTASTDPTVESLFLDFLHYARLGRFTAADAFAEALLEHPDLNPVVVLDVANQDKASLETLLILIQNSTISDRALRVLELIHEGEFEKRRDPERIAENILKLGGDPQQEFYAIKHLAESGEYAIPPMLETLLKPEMDYLKPRVVSALPKIGKAAVNPLVMALQVGNDDTRLHVIHALGEIGYPQALPYLSRLFADTATPDSCKEAARVAIGRIEAISGRTVSGTPDEQFFHLAEKYYDQDASVCSDARLPESNVWYWDDQTQTVYPVVVPQRLFGSLMAMRCCEETLLLTPNKVEAGALWLAANIRRESLLGLNIESGDPEELGEPDPTRPEVFPRALYFTQAAGPRYAHLVLERAVANHEAGVALGAIEALRITAGEASLIGTEDHKQPLVRALQFPDLLVRIRAALALGAALPKSQFAGSQLVVPVLSSALTQSGKRQILVVDTEEQNLNRVMDALRGADTEVIGEVSFYKGLSRARTEFSALSALYLSTDLVEPNIATALAELRAEFAFSKLPVIIMVKPGQTLVADELVAMDKYADRAEAAADSATLSARYEDINARTGQMPFDPELALSIALKSAETMRRIAVDGQTVFDFESVEPALIAVLSSQHEELQIKAASVLALARSEAAQRSIAHLALDPANTVALRVAAFGSLAESAKNHGGLLESDQVAELVKIARDDEDLVIRTAASEALGAVNLKTSKASEIIRKYYGG